MSACYIRQANKNILFIHLFTLPIFTEHLPCALVLGVCECVNRAGGNEEQLKGYCNNPGGKWRGLWQGW